MKRTLFAIILACCTLALAAQGHIHVNYQGARPTISDFAWAYLSYADNEEDDGCVNEAARTIKQAWIRHREGIPQPENVKFLIDQGNAYVLYESNDSMHRVRIEMCYWNEADGKHKLFAYNVSTFMYGRYVAGQFDGPTFYRYDNATKEMVYCVDLGFDVECGADDGARVSYSLPRAGQNITVTRWYTNAKKLQTLKWDGRRFQLLKR
jgi:hypothetical protein